MAVKWIKAKSPGVRYHEHGSRKQGVRFDRYYSIRYKLNGKDKEEGLGWASQGWTEQKAVERLAELKQNQRNGEGPQSLAEKRELENNRKAAELAEQRRAKIEAIIFGDYFKDAYLPEMAHKKSKDVEQFIYDKWVKPVIGKIKINDIADFHLKKIKKNMQDNGKAIRTIHYAFAIVSQVWNRARKDKIVQRDCPTRDVKLPRIDNQKKRFLSLQQANDLLDYLKRKSTQLYSLAYLSLYTGARFSELAGLTWRRVNLEEGSIIFRNTKSGKDRMVFMTEGVKSLLEGTPKGAEGSLIFPDRKGKRLFSVSATFDRAIVDLGLNNGVTDPRDRITFHSLRHTHASWLVNNGTNLFLVKEILGHADFKMTTRYSHPAADSIRQAMVGLEKHITGTDKQQSGQVLNLTK